MFQAAVTAEVGSIVCQTHETPPRYLVKLRFSFAGNELLLSAEVTRIRETARKAVAPLKPAAGSIGWGKRTIAGSTLPAYYLVYFLLVELLEFPHTGGREKIAWSIPVEFEGQIASIEHRKMGLGIFSSTEAEDELVAARIVRAIEKGLRTAAPYFDHVAAEAVQHSRLNVNNNSAWLFSRYEYLRDQFREKAASAESLKGAVEITEAKTANGRGRSVLYSYPAYRLMREAAWSGIAAIDAFFSWTEHVLIQIAILNGKLRTGQEVAHLATADWSEKIKTALDLGDKKTKQQFDELLRIRRRIRNYMAHGSLEKTPRKIEFNYSLNLSLPTGTLHATGVGADVLGSAKAAFAELEAQVKKHQAKLRKDFVWKRKRAIAMPTPRKAPSSD